MNTTATVASAASGPLLGITVIDLTRVLAGPFATQLLADMGARVIKVETPEKGDDARAFGPFIEGKSTYFMSLNRGKESITLNLKHAKDKALFLELVEQADILVENFRPGAMDKLGLGWEALHALNPKLIYASCSGFGHTGPDKHKPAYDMVVQAMGGLMSITGLPDSEPVRVGTSIGDITAGLYTSNAIMAALYHRQISGKGDRIDVAMLDCQIAILENAIARYLATGTSPEPMGSRHPAIAPFECYQTQDSYIVIAAGNDALFAKLCEVLDKVELAKDERFISNPQRVEHAEMLKTYIEAGLKIRTTSEWLSVLEAAGIPCGPLNNIEDAVTNSHILSRNMIQTLNDPTAGEIQVAGNPIKMHGFDELFANKPAPSLDQDREDILQKIIQKNAA